MKKTYLTLIALSIAGITNASIIYTDIPDATLSSAGSININFNGTGGDEFTISDMGFGATVEPGIMFNGANFGFATVSTGEWDVMKGLTNGTTINTSTGFYNNGGDAYIDPGWATYSFPTGQDEYIGAQFEIAGSIYFGWIRVNWNGAGTLIIKDFAYNNVANAAIDAGDMGVTTITQVNKSAATVSIYPNPTTDYLMINVKNSDLSIHHFKIIDGNGNEVQNTTFSKSTTLNISQLSTGVYYLVSREDRDQLINRFIKK